MTATEDFPFQVLSDWVLTGSLDAGFKRGLHRYYEAGTSWSAMRRWLSSEHLHSTAVGVFIFLRPEGWSEKPVKWQDSDKLGQLRPDVCRIPSLHLFIKNGGMMNRKRDNLELLLEVE